eukprot:5122235-Pyramimonas_sp.AAC.1
MKCAEYASMRRQHEQTIEQQAAEQFAWEQMPERTRRLLKSMAAKGLATAQASARAKANKAKNGSRSP